MARSRASEAGPEARHFLDGERHDVTSGLPHSESADGRTRTSQAHRLALQKGLLESVRDLAGCVGELIAQRTIDSGGAFVNGGGRRAGVAG